MENITQSHTLYEFVIIMRFFHSQEHFPKEKGISFECDAISNGIDVIMATLKNPLFPVPKCY